jgi:NitT/TauT family transport system ATP-binding protein
MSLAKLQLKEDAHPSDNRLAVEVIDLVHKYSGMEVISTTSLNIREGEFVSIVGPSGCGKTTLLNIVAGLTPCQQGAVRLSGSPPREGRPDIAYMLARDSLLPWRSALENAAFGAKIRGVDPQRRNDKALHLLASVGLTGFETRFPKELSHGMRQRVALARTFCLDSPLLLMDEPFGALDAQTKLQLEDILLQLWSEERRTVIFITHDLSEAIALSDRVIVMRRRPGAIIADIPITLPRPRSVRKLQSSPQYHELYAQIWSTLEKALETS